ncbi:MAG TPA: pyridoxal-phosphate dependent enzyme, partial [Candidatus Limnocylindria bacterium]|nr:pyridoxal-phosphate dependent enzyme [Candidatus Limnocylindria bacterium]
LGTSAVVVMPRHVSPTIVGVCRAYGAEVILEGDVFDDAEVLAHRIEREQGRTFIHPYADRLIVAGQGTIGLELLEELPDLDQVVVAVGGGGLSAGIALAVKSERPRVRVIGVEPAGSDEVGRSVRAGAPVVLERPASVADKLVARTTMPMAVELGRRYMDDYVTVSEEALEAATYELLDRLSLLIEPSGAAPLAAVREGKLALRGLRTVLIASGGNIAPAVLARILRERTT